MPPPPFLTIYSPNPLWIRQSFRPLHSLCEGGWGRQDKIKRLKCEKEKTKRTRMVTSNVGRRTPDHAFWLPRPKPLEKPSRQHNEFTYLSQYLNHTLCSLHLFFFIHQTSSTPSTVAFFIPVKRLFETPQSGPRLGGSPLRSCAARARP